MGSLEIALYAKFWNDILERFNATNKLLQDPQMFLSSAVEALKSLRSFVVSKREIFDKYEDAARKISQVQINIRKHALGNKLVQFVAIIDACKKDCNVDSEPKEMVFYRILMDNNLSVAFPNIEITLRMYLVLIMANCSGERWFSKMKMI